MSKRFALGTIFACMCAIGIAYASAFLPGGAPRAAAWVMAIGTAGAMVAVLFLGAARANRLPNPALTVVFAFTFAVMVAGFCLALAAPKVSADAALWLGLPAGAASILYVVGLLPLLVLPLAYAITFDQATFSDEELESIRRRLNELREESP